MGELAVFVPGGCKSHRDALIPLGLGGLIDERVSVSAYEGSGPSDLFGIHFRFSHDNEPDYPTRKIENNAHWQPLAKDGELAAGRAWLGWNEDDPPGPMDLMRKELREGTFVKLNDGRDWMVPIARQLPCVMAPNQDGLIVSTPTARYRAFWDAAGKALSWFEASDGKLRVEFDEGYQFALDSLCINYRMTRDLLGALGLLTTKNLFDVARTVCEWDAIADMLAQKKTDSTDATQPICAGATG